MELTVKYLRKCLPLIRRPFVVFPRLHSHPYSWLRGTNLPVAVDHSWAKAHFFLNFGLFMIQTCFAIGRTIQTYSDLRATVVNKFLMTFVSVMYTGFASHYATIVLTRHTFVPFLRRYIRFLQSGETNLERKAKRVFPHGPYIQKRN